MKAYVDESRIITQFLPSLLHLAIVKVGFLLINKFDYATLIKAYKRIQEGSLIDPDEINKDPNLYNNRESLLKCKLDHLQCEYELLRCRKIYSAKRQRRLELRRLELEKRKNLLERSMIEYLRAAEPLMKQYKAQQILSHKIPISLRLRVIEAVQGMEFEVRFWKSLFDKLELRDEERRFCWKSDGSLDETETARQVALNRNIDIKHRFLIACCYCFVEIMHALWSEMENSNETFFTSYDNAIVHFWVRRMVSEPRVHWKQDFCDYLNRYRKFVDRFVRFFPFLPSQDRKVFLPYLKSKKLDYFRRYFNVMTKEEEEWVLKSCPGKLLLSFLRWPYRSMFLETADKMWNYIDKYDFLLVLERLFLIKKCEQFDISDLFVGFWERSPREFRSSVKKLPFLKKKIKSWLKEIRKKEKAHEALAELRSLTKARVDKTHGKLK